MFVTRFYPFGTTRSWLGVVLTLCLHLWARGPVCGQADLDSYFERQVAALESRGLPEVESAEQWLSQRDTRRRELQRMLGLDPWPERTSLNPVITATHQRDGVVVENLHFQALPGLYVTANLYRPALVTGRLPAVLYVCGHGREVVGGVSVGNKTHYQHHGAWFARHGYVCLMIDTVQLGEIEGVHHGTYKLDMWWWESRGYTPAGVEAWNGIRALDYLQSRAEVDPERIGMTGRSGGGAYSWWVAALDERVKVVVPVAGITNLRDHVVNGCVEGHCDCMYPVNTYRWDFPMVAALIAPRPLLIANTDKDTIFPLNGVLDVYRQARAIYRLLGAEAKIGLNITEGPHRDTQELQIHAFRWLNRHLKQDEQLISIPAEPLFELSELKVFAELPTDQINTTIQETFVRPASFSAPPREEEAWKALKNGWMENLKTESCVGWPVPFGSALPRVAVESETESSLGGIRVQAYRILSETDVQLGAWSLIPMEARMADARSIRLQIISDEQWAQVGGSLEAAARGAAVDSTGWAKLAAETRRAWDMNGTVTVCFAPRGIGPTRWTDDVAKLRQIQRRFALIGQTWETMQIWDICQVVQAIRQVDGAAHLPLTIVAEGPAAGMALYAALATEGVTELALTDLPATHRDGPQLLSVQRNLDLPQALAMVGERAAVRLLVGADRSGDTEWSYVRQVAAARGWPENRFQIDRRP